MNATKPRDLDSLDHVAIVVRDRETTVDWYLHVTDPSGNTVEILAADHSGPGDNKTR